MFLTKTEEKMCEGEYGETIRKSMDILVALGDIYGAEKFVEITSAQVSGVSYKTIGEAGLEYLEDLALSRISTKIPSTLNPAGTDLDNWRKLGFNEDFAKKQVDIVNAYSALGISPSCTCTPYLIGNVPRFKDHISWSESSAVAYANSVLGARTNREGGPGALASAIIGRTPYYGFHLDENRNANLKVEVNTKLSGIEFGALGYIVGQIVSDGIPYFKLNNTPTNNDLKTLGAALASSGAVALYYVENLSPEFDTVANVNDAEDKISISKDDILNTCEKLSTTKDLPDLVCLGCPHSSLEEIKSIADFVEGKKIENELWVCTSINVKAIADRLNYTNIIEDAGGHIVQDTCMVVAPIEDMGYKTIGVNSAKAANYVPSMCGLDVVYDNFENLIKFK